MSIGRRIPTTLRSKHDRLENNAALIDTRFINVASLQKSATAQPCR
jgi:hypothetical protein